eukprot:3765752-Pyramimonas_sp.AAC.1
MLLMLAQCLDLLDERRGDCPPFRRFMHNVCATRGSRRLLQSKAYASKSSPVVGLLRVRNGVMLQDHLE